jgi:hypothetical protein
MVDMGQADSGLYRKPVSEQHVMCWTRALGLAAKEMGYGSYMDVPERDVDALKERARDIQRGKQ